MNDFKLKMILSLLAGVVFSFLFILLAFVLPLKQTETQIIKKPTGKLEQVAHSFKNR
jgi:Na+-transporting methylmalonyl-CoA/oxaloacetate decarboxylase gamma subunit